MIEIQNLKMNVGNRQLNANQSLTFLDGTVSFIKGVSGAGKTTLLYVLGLVSKQTNYSYFYNGTLISKQEDKELIRKNEIGMLYQNFNVLNELTLYENLKLFADINSCELTKDKIEEIFNELSLKVELDRKFESLSGGEKQRFCLACILVKNPQVIIADEPTSALDKENAKQIMAILNNLANKHGKIVIVSTHTNAYDDIANQVITLTKEEMIVESINTKASIYHLSPYSKKVNPSFYKNMIIHRFKQTLKHSWLVFMFMVVSVSISVFLLNYSYVSRNEYTSYINQSLENEAFLMPSSNESLLSEEELTYIKSIPGVENVYSVKMTYGTVVYEDGTEDMVKVFSLAPFQNGYQSDVCKGDAYFQSYKGEMLQLKIGDYISDYKIDSILNYEKVGLYSSDITIKNIFLNESEFKNFDGFETSLYVVEISNFSRFEEIVSKVEVATDKYDLTSSYHYFTNLLDSLKQQEIFINFACVGLIGISFLLFVLTQIHEQKTNVVEISVFQANGLSKRNVFQLEILYFFFKLVLYFVLCTGFSILLILMANVFILEAVSLHFNLTYAAVLLGLLGVYIFIPWVILVTYHIRKSPEDVLRSL